LGNRSQTALSMKGVYCGVCVCAGEADQHVDVILWPHEELGKEHKSISGTNEAVGLLTFMSSNFGIAD
jgi:hypothetical protein